jgi:hypothetical protein
MMQPEDSMADVRAAAADSHRHHGMLDHIGNALTYSRLLKVTFAEWKQTT